MNSAWNLYLALGLEFEPWTKWPKRGKPVNRPAGSKVERTLKKHRAVKAAWRDAAGAR